MRKLLSVFLLVLLAGAAEASLLGRFPSLGTIGGPSGTSGGTSQGWVLSETLFHPVAFAADKAGVTISAVPRLAKTVRLAYRTVDETSWTTLARCWKDRRDSGDTKDTDGTCNVGALERVDFVLCDPNDSYNSCLTEDTHYVYRLEELVAGEWLPKGQSDFYTIGLDPDATQRVAFISDEHISQRLSQAGCALKGSADEEAETANWFQTLANLQSLQGTRNYRAYISSGDTFQTHGLNYTDTPCTKIEGASSGGCGYGQPCSGSRINSVITQSEADMRVLFTFQIMQPILRQLPFIWTCGNHDPCGFTYAENHGGTISQSKSEHWYLSDTDNINVYGQLALHRWMPNPAFTYGGVEGNATADADGRWFSLMIGPAELVVLCAECGTGEDPAGIAADGDLDQDGTPWEAPNLFTPGEGDFPGNVDGWNDWYPGRNQCNYMTGATDCSGTAGRLRDVTWDANTDGDDTEATTPEEVYDVFYKITLRHHVFGSTTLTNSGKWYGRGGQGAVDRRCDADGTTMCTTDSDCVTLIPSTCPAYTGLEDMAGYEADVQRELAAFAATVGGKSYAANLMGHDHLSNAGVKFTAGPTNTHVAYIHGVQPAGSQAGPGWADNTRMIAASDWGGDDNTPDGVADYCDNSSVEAIELFGDNFYACHSFEDDSATYDQTGIGSLTRGFIEMEFQGREAVNFRQIATVSTIDAAAGFSLLNKAELWQMTLSEDQGAPSGDTTAPVISNLASSNVTTTAAQIDWDTDDLATSRVLYAVFPALPTSGTPISDTPANLNGVTSHTIVLTNLVPGTDYNYQAESTNDAGLTTFSSMGTFSTPNPPAPIISNFRFINSSTASLTFAWSTDVASSTQVKCGTVSGTYLLQSANDTTPVFSHSATVSGLSEGTLYYCVGISANTPGGTTTSPEVSATTDIVGVGALTMGDLLTPEAVAMIDADGDGVAESLRWPEWDDTTYQAAKGWQEIDVTCATGICPSGLPPMDTDAGLSGCTPITDAGTNALNLQCMFNNAAAQTRLVVPDGTYSFTSTAPGNQIVRISRSDIVLAAQNPGGATFVSYNTRGPNPTGCNYVQGSMFTICGGSYLTGATAKAWTAGYANGDTTLTVPSHGFSPGDDIDVYMNTNTACDRFQRLTNQGQQTDATHHYTTVVSAPTSDTITIADPLRGSYGGPGCSGHSVRKVTPIENIGIEGLVLTHHASIPLSTSPGVCGGGSNCAKFPKVVISQAKNVWIIGNKFSRNFESWLKVAFGASDVAIIGNWFDELDPGIVSNTEGVWVQRGARVHIDNNYITQTNVASKIEVGAETNSFSYNLVPCDAGGPKRAIERAILGAHGFWTRQTLIQGNDFCGNPDISDLYWGENEGPMGYYGNRVVGSGSGECDRTSYMAVNSDGNCPSPGTNCCLPTLNNPDHCYATDVLFEALNAPYNFIVSPRLGQCPALNTGFNFNDVVQSHYFERNTYRHPSGPIKLGSPIVNDTNVQSSVPPAAWSGLTAPDSLSYEARPFWWPASPPAGVCTWPYRAALDDDFTGTLCKLPAECYWVDGDPTCAPF